MDSEPIVLTIDRVGRVLLPKPLRERMGFRPGSEIEVVPGHGMVVLKAKDSGPSLAKIDGVWVHQGELKGASSAPDVVSELRQDRLAAAMPAA